MSAVRIIAEVKAAGIQLWHIGDKLKMSAAAKPDEGLVARIKTAKPDIIAHLQSLDAERQADHEPAADGVRPGAGPVAAGEPPRFPSGVQLDAHGMPIFDTSKDHLLGDGIVASAVRNQRRAMVAAAERACGVAELRSSRSEDQPLARASMAVDQPLAGDPGEAGLRGEVDE